ncbi:MAG: hypothetical protein ACFE0O_00285 [Opitutales bacterium]
MVHRSRDPFSPEDGLPSDAADADLEARLKRLRPAEPPDPLAVRIQDAVARSMEQPAGGDNSPLRAVDAPKPSRQPEDGLSLGRPGWGWLWAPAAAVAALAVVILVDRRMAPEADAGPMMATEPVEVEVGQDGQFMDPQIARISKVNARSFLYDAIDEGIVLTDNDRAVRQYRYRFLESVVLQNPEDGSILTMDIPREEIVQVPVQTF